MKRLNKLFIFPILLATVLGVVGCSSDDENITEPAVTDVNVLLIKSDKGETSIGTMYKSGEGYRPPHCFLGHPVTFEGDTIYHMSFSTKIKGSDVFNGLGITNSMLWLRSLFRIL